MLKIIKPQDLVVLMKIVSFNGKPFIIKDISEALMISASEVHQSLERSRTSGLLDASKQRVQKLALMEFLEHGLKYVFPVELGAVVRGVPTAFSASPVKERVVQGKEVVVWRTSKGSTRGHSIEPLYKTVPDVALRDKGMYELLAIVECLRMGRRREVEIALEELKGRLNYE